MSDFDPFEKPAASHPRRMTEPSDLAAIRTNATINSETYQPEVWRVQKDVIYAAIPAVEAGLEYAKESLCIHDQSYGREIGRYKRVAAMIESDIAQMEGALLMLRACGP